MNNASRPAAEWDADEAAERRRPRFFCRAKRCTNPAAPDAEVACPACGRAY